MKIRPKFDGKIPVAAIVEFNTDDVLVLAEILSYARDAGDDKTQKMATKLAAVCEGLDAGAETGIEHTRDYHRVRRLFDPEYHA